MTTTLQQWRARKDALVAEMKALNRETSGRGMTAAELSVYERLASRARSLACMIRAAEEVGEC